jgi:NAD(P)-dependent dehydrogenase (short-subunit alcohol dehydrogenase family)
MSTNFSLAGKSALVTGAARGIGRAVAVAFARAGASMIAGLDIAGRASPIQDYDIPDEAALAETGRLVEALGARFLPLTCDQRDSVALRAAVAKVHTAFGRIDIVAAIAGIQAFKSLLDMQDADWDDQIDINLTGTAKLIRAVAPIMVQQGGGRIIVTSSTQGQHGMRDGSAYSASKWGLFGMMKSAALELGPHQITVNAVVPGLIDTPLTRHYSRYAQAMLEGQGKLPEGMPEQELDQKVQEAQKKKIPLGVAFLPPEDVAGAYVYLASAAGRLVTGASLAVTGGDSAHNLA